MTGANVLVALVLRARSHAVYFLQKQDMTRLDAVNYISHGIAKVPGRSPHASGQRRRRGGRRRERRAKQGNEALEAYCVDLNQKARDGRIDPLIGREHEIERTIQILCRRTKNNPLYRRRSRRRQDRHRRGAGARIVDGEVPEVLQERDHLLARHGRAAGRHALSRRLRGAAEGRARASSKATPDAVLFIDEIHTVIGAGATSRRLDGCLEPPEAGAGVGRAALHRLDDLQGIPQPLREGPRAGPPLPEDRRRRALDRGCGQDPARV